MRRRMEVPVRQTETACEMDLEPHCDTDEEVFGPVTLKEVKKAHSMRRKTEVPIRPTAYEMDLEPYCDSDEEVFWGPVTLKEAKKILSMRRKTEVFNPVRDEHCNKDGSRDAANESASPQRRESVGSPLSDAETPAPPPSPELSAYAGSPCPTPCHTRQQAVSNLKEIAEDDNCVEVSHSKKLNSSARFSSMECFIKWRQHNPLGYSFDDSNESLSILSRMDDDLEATETPPYSNERNRSVNSGRSTRVLLIEKMKQHKERTEQLLNTKKQSTSNSKMLSEGTSDDVINLDESDLNISSDEGNLAGPQSHLEEDEILIDDEVQDRSERSSSDADDELDNSSRFSRLVSEKDMAASLDEQKCDTLAAENFCLSSPVSGAEEQISPSEPSCLNNTIDLQSSGLEDDVPGRPVSPEYDIVPVSNSYSAANYSFISDTEEELLESTVNKGENDVDAVVSADKDGGYLSILSEAALLHASLKQGMQDSSRAPAGEEERENSTQSVCLDSSGPSERSCGREMDAAADLNESDRRHLTFSEGQFNDTLEDMEMLMKYGLDYMMSGNLSKMSVNVSTPNNHGVSNTEFEDFGDAIHDQVNTDVQSQSWGSLQENSSQNSNDVKATIEMACAMEKTTPVQTFPPTKTDTTTKKQAIVSPLVKPSPFKMPTTPSLRNQHLPLRPSKKSPLKPANPSKIPVSYKRIVSPVGAYIHSPSQSLITLIKPRSATMTRTRAVIPSPLTRTVMKVPFTLEEKERGQENVDTSNLQPVLPVVAYKSAPAVKLEERSLEKMPRLNEKLKKLIDTPRARVHRHEGRVKVDPSSQQRTGQLYCSGSRSVNPDDSVVSNGGAGEISVIVDKHASRSNTLGF